MIKSRTPLEQAVRFTSKEHEGLFRDGDRPLPYATHAIEVMSLVRYIGGVTDEEVLCAAALHDTVEQSGTPLEKVRKRFGARVAGLVRELTRAEAKGSKKNRFELLLEEVRAMSPEAKTIKLADRLSNLRLALIARPASKRKEYAEKTLKILAEIPKETNPALWGAVDELARSA
jgi:(p)ppGpp synthase/HD superfamily hydrolase